MSEAEPAASLRSGVSDTPNPKQSPSAFSDIPETPSSLLQTPLTSLTPLIPETPGISLTLWPSETSLTTIAKDEESKKKEKKVEEKEDEEELEENNQIEYLERRELFGFTKKTDGICFGLSVTYRDAIAGNYDEKLKKLIYLIREIKAHNLIKTITQAQEEYKVIFEKEYKNASEMALVHFYKKYPPDSDKKEDVGLLSTLRE